MLTSQMCPLPTLVEYSLCILSSGATATNVLTDAIAGHLVPLDLLSCHGQLSPQGLEGTLAQTREASVQLFLVLLLVGTNLLDDSGARARRDRSGAGLVGQEPHVAVLVVVNVHLDATLQAARRRVEDVERSPATIPVCLD